MLVVTNAYVNQRTRHLVPEERFLYCLTRTIRLFHHLSRTSPVFEKHRKILEQARNAASKIFHSLPPV